MELAGVARAPMQAPRAAAEDPGRDGSANLSVPAAPGTLRIPYRRRLADAIRPVQSGDVNLYLLYVFAVILLGAV